jgi:hypothetical protein
MEEQTQLEQRLTEVLLQLPIPVRIERRQPEPGRGWGWYEWRCLGEMRECSTFTEAVNGALHHLQRRLLADDPSRLQPLSEGEEITQARAQALSLWQEARRLTGAGGEGSHRAIFSQLVEILREMKLVGASLAAIRQAQLEQHQETEAVDQALQEAKFWRDDVLRLSGLAF